jgi:hypothetical protein
MVLELIKMNISILAWPDSRPQLFFASVFVKGPPCTTDGTANTSNCTDLAMLSTLLSKLNDLIAKLLLCISA